MQCWIKLGLVAGKTRSLPAVLSLAPKLVNIILIHRRYFEERPSVYFYVDMFFLL